MGQITNIYCKPLALQISKYSRTGNINDLGHYEREIIQPGKSFVGNFNKKDVAAQDYYVWPGEDCYISCDNPELPQYYADLPPDIKAKTWTVGVVTAGIYSFVNSGVA